MTFRTRLEDWIRQHRAALLIAWGAICAVVVVVLLLGPDYYMVRGIAPLPRFWAVLLFLSLWSWAALRFIAKWIWAWTVMVLAPLSLFIPLRHHLDATWLMPLIMGVIVVSTLNLAVVAWWEWRRERRA